jgi:hypothetical protein
MMARDFPEIGHEFDVWHWVKVNKREALYLA